MFGNESTDLPTIKVDEKGLTVYWPLSNYHVSRYFKKDIISIEISLKNGINPFEDDEDINIYNLNIYFIGHDNIDINIAHSEEDIINIFRQIEIW